MLDQTQMAGREGDGGSGDGGAEVLVAGVDGAAVFEGVAGVDEGEGFVVDEVGGGEDFEEERFVRCALEGGCASVFNEFRVNDGKRRDDVFIKRNDSL